MKKRNKVNAEFSMSSLTDIIFLLLIFFMLTSSLVQINMPIAKSDSKVVAPVDLAVMMMKDGKVTFNGKSTTMRSLEKQIYSTATGQSNNENATVTIIAEVGVPWSKVSDVMAIASKLQVKAIIATEARK
jgi:biopolymer transport protein ExbD